MTTDKPVRGLTEEQLKLVEQVLHTAIERPLAERAAFVRAQCGDDARVLEEVSSLLDRLEDDGRITFLESGNWLPALEDAERYLAAEESKPGKSSRRSDGAMSEKQSQSGSAKKSPSWGDFRRGDQIDSYIIRAPIGEGGFAHVYLAEQTEPIRMRVALKILKPGMDSQQLIARFEAERQALALMDHPHVAHVFNAGATKTGRPYFVMEHVAGAAITDYCDRHRLNIQQRLELFIQACEAVQHAHQKGIIHRDLKPSNVMVTLKDGAPAVKVIDFGVAKAINKEMSEQTIFTEQGQLIGTPEYMSPEQAEMSDLDIDTRADIYSLGVLLYEVLAGALPFDKERLRQKPYTEIQRVIREVDPPRPSARLTTLVTESSDIAKHRNMDARALRRRLHGDLDWITMKAMEKDRTRRYASASEFAADIRRHLTHEPVLAGPPSAAYKLSKFIKKHRGRVAAAAVIAIVVTAGLIASLLLLAQLALANTALTDARDVSDRRATQLEIANRFLQAANEKIEAQAFSLSESPIGVLILNKNGKCEYVNEKVLDITGGPREELEEQIVYEMESWDRSGMAGMAREAFRTGQSKPRAFAQRSSYAQLFSFDARFVRYPSGDRVLVLMTMQDNDYQQRYDHLLEAVPEPVVEFDSTTLKMVRANAAAEKLFGRAREDLAGLLVTDLCADPKTMTQKLGELVTDEYLPIRLAPFRDEFKRNDETFAAMVSLQKIIKPGQVTIQGVIVVRDADHD